jgi:hypothetical protein
MPRGSCLPTPRLSAIARSGRPAAQCSNTSTTFANIRSCQAIFHEHLVLAHLVHWHAAHVHHVANSQRRCWTLRFTSSPEWKPQVFFQVVVPANRLFLGPGINDDLHPEPLFEIVVASSARHRPLLTESVAHYRLAHNAQTSPCTERKWDRATSRLIGKFGEGLPVKLDRE